MADADESGRVLRRELTPLLQELTRIRVLLERLEARFDDSAASSPLLEESSPDRDSYTASTARLDSAAPIVATPIEPDVAPAASEVALLQSLLDLYPGDAAAVFFAFDRQIRCSPQHLDLLARRSGLEDAWNAANRVSLRSLVERYHGGLALVAEMLGRDSDSLAALVERIGMREYVDDVCERERRRLREAELPKRLEQLLFRAKLARDLGMVEELDARTWQDLQERCAALSGESSSAAEVLERLAEECNLDSTGLDRLLRRYELRRFVADLFKEPEESVRPMPRRSGRSVPRRALSDDEIETRILHMLRSKGKVGAAHTHIDHLMRTVPTHERGRAREAVDRLIAAGLLQIKVTDNSAEPHISLVVGAVQEIEARLP